MIEVVGLTKRYNDVTVVNDVSFSVARGEVLGFLGPNGAGKTTTMRMLTGYLPATSGQVTIAGYDIQREPLKARSHIGYLPEGVPLYPEMTVAGYLDHMARLRNVAGRRDAVERAMGLVHMSERANDRIGKLSKGQRQRVGLAQALLHDPDVLILDEPTVGLDPRQIIEVRELIRELGATRTVILSTHILPEVSMLCNRVVIIKKGQVVAVDTPAGLTARLQGADRVEMRVQADKIDPAPLLHIAGVTSVTNDTPGHVVVETEPGHELRPAIAGVAIAQQWGLLELRQVTLSLEEIFLELTTQETIDVADTAPVPATEGVE
ncbi:MAG: ABC transporter ATP-binding protein [Chloroflexota bacterium]|jgi:ABC-2 type transport system ATP-binding protein